MWQPPSCAVGEMRSCRRGRKTRKWKQQRVRRRSGTAVRLYKYVIGDYFHDFATSAREWARSNVAVWPSGFGSHPQAAALRRLYGPRVVRDAVMQNLGDVAASHEDRRVDITERWQWFLVLYLLRTDDPLTISRCCFLRFGSVSTTCCS